MAIRELLKRRQTFFLERPLVGMIDEEKAASEPPHETHREGAKPASGRTYIGQSTESYCVECIEGHTMAALTEMRHAIDRYRSSGTMSEGVQEKVRIALAELQGIEADVVSVEGASPEVKQGLNDILVEARWLRKEYGVSNKGLTIGKGTQGDLEELRDRISGLQKKAYSLVQNCPTCRIGD